MDTADIDLKPSIEKGVSIGVSVLDGSADRAIDKVVVDAKEDVLDTTQEVMGPDGQVCYSQEVLDQVLTRYTHIHTNVFRGGANGKIPNEFMRCDCKYTVGEDEVFMACGYQSGCINRELSIECGIDCPTGEYCNNKKFQYKDYADMQIFKTRKKGFGLRTKEILKKGEFVIEYCGEVLGAGLFQKRIEEYSKKGARHFYFMSLKANEHIDASKKGNVSRFMNHSCDPNCVLEKWVVGNQMRVGLFAKRDIPKGEELTFDYKFERYGSKAQVCYCGASTCTGYIGKEKSGPILNLEELDGLSEEEEEESESNQFQQKVVTGRPLTTIDHVKDLVKYLMLHSSTPNKILKALNRILKTEMTWLLRKFVHYRGIYMLHRCLLQHLNGKEILRYNLLLALKSLPVSTKNPVQEIEKLIEDLENVNEYGEKTATLAAEILESWKDLEIVYKIPKRVNVMNEEVEEREVKKPKVEHQIQVQEQSGYITHQIDDPISKPVFAWNTLVAVERTESVTSITTSNPTVDTLSETSIQQMVKAAQEATKSATETAKKKQQEDQERKRKLIELKKKKLKAQKEKLKEMQMKAKDEGIEKREKMDIVLSVEQRSNLKAQISQTVISILSRYKAQLSSQDFKEKAKIITRALLEKEVRRYADKGKDVPEQMSEQAMNAAKKYVKEYLSRHDIN